jgi:hypothetical protein
MPPTTSCPSLACALRCIATGGVLLLSLAASFAAENPSPVMLANAYHRGIPLTDYRVSKKYDGVRGYRDGEKLRACGGEIIAVPAWFVAGWPSIPMDVELCAGRGKFAEAVSTVRTQKPTMPHGIACASWCSICRHSPVLSVSVCRSCRRRSPRWACLWCKPSNGKRSPSTVRCGRA